MIDSETGLPYDWSNPGGGAASTQPESAPPPAGFNQQPNASGSGSPLAASTQPVYAPPPAGFNQQANAQGGGVSPLLMQLLGGQGGGIYPLLMQYLMGQQQQQQPQFGAPNAAQQSWMSQMGWGNDLNALTPMQRGGLNTALGTTSGPDALANAQYNTPQDFVSQWQKMYGRL